MSARVAITVSTFDRASMLDALRVLSFANVLWLRSEARAGRPLPRLFDTRVRFRPEPQAGNGVELYQTIPEVIAQGWGDCDDLTGWRCAELLVSGESGADCELLAIGPGVWHAVVRRASGAIEDVAAIIQQQERSRWR